MSVDVVVVFVVEYNFPRTGRKGRVFYIHRLADRSPNHQTYYFVKGNDSLLKVQHSLLLSLSVSG